MKLSNIVLVMFLLAAASATRFADASPPPDADDAKPAANQAAAASDEEKTTVTRDADGNAVVHMSDDAQGDAGILVKLPAGGTWSPEVKGYGRVIDPAPLADLLTELATDQAASTASSNELVRQKTLAAQGNSSARALETAEATALHDQLATRAAREKFKLSAGQAIAEQPDLPAFISALASQTTALARIDVPASESPAATPTGVRLVTLSGAMTEGEYLGPAVNVDPQIQGRGYLFLVTTNTLHLLPGEAVTGYLKMPGEPLKGLIIPREAVVRTEGKGWVYEMSEGSDAFTRREIALDRPTDSGWFVTNGLTAGKYVVTTGAQILLSEEMKGALSPD